MISSATLEGTTMEISDQVQAARHAALDQAWVNGRLEGVEVDPAAKDLQRKFADGLINETELHAQLQSLPVGRP